METIARSAPIITSISVVPTNGYFFAYNALIFQCTADGSPTPRYSWLFNGVEQTVNPTSGTLSISSAAATDAGSYVCKASNQWGTALSDVIDMQPAFINDFTDRTTKTLSVPAGSSYAMQCRGKPTSQPNPTYAWLQQVATSDSASSGAQITEDDRRQIDQTDGTLYFANVDPADRNPAATFYTCAAGITSCSNVGSYVDFTVSGSLPSTPKAPTTAFRNPKTDTVIVLEGQSASFKCFFYGYPTPSISWTRAGQSVSSGDLSAFNTVYTIDVVQESDDNTVVTCIGSNTASFAMSSFNFILTVHTRPMFNSNFPGPTDVNATIGDTVTFVCNPKANPAIDALIWFINGNQLDAINLPSNYLVSGTNLKISNISLTDFLVVTCEASNSIGSVRAQGSLMVLEPTKIVEPPSDKKVKVGDATSFNCMATSDSTTPVIFSWYFNDALIKYTYNIQAKCSSLSWSWSCALKIKQVQRSQAGYYWCSATNTYSSDVSTKARLLLSNADQIWNASTLLPVVCSLLFQIWI